MTSLAVNRIYIPLLSKTLSNVNLADRLTTPVIRGKSGLEREEKFPFVQINPRDTRRVGIADRRPVLVSTRRGEVNALARVTDAIIPGVLFMTFHFEKGPAALTNAALGPQAKIPEYKVYAARVRKQP